MKKVIPVTILFLALVDQTGFCADGDRVHPKTSMDLTDINLSGLSQEAPPVEVPSFLVKKKDQKVEGERDPFLLPGRKNKENSYQAFGKYELTAIILGNHQGLAIINGNILREGDSINGAIIQRIMRDRVFLSQEGETLEVKVKPFGEE